MLCLSCCSYSSYYQEKELTFYSYCTVKIVLTFQYFKDPLYFPSDFKSKRGCKGRDFFKTSKYYYIFFIFIFTFADYLDKNKALDMDKKLVIIPTYNEKENIEKMLQTVLRFEEAFDLLIVDDGSPDGTAAIVKKVQERAPNRIHIIEREGKQGLGTAYMTGFK